MALTLITQATEFASGTILHPVQQSQNKYISYSIQVAKSRNAKELLAYLQGDPSTVGVMVTTEFAPTTVDPIV
jgi:hypothetical protein